MEVDQAHYPQQLLSILKHISSAAFVTIDLEMSGIATRPKNGYKSRDSGRPTLQQQYEETKDAAETFQVLQIGITCVEEDIEKEMYLARPYNFNVSPLFLHGDKLDIDRKFSFSSSACDFLLRNNFDFGKAFLSGVSYLSQEEELYARQYFDERAGQNSTKEDIIVSPNEPETVQFYRNARKTISAWLKDPEADFVNVGSEGGPLNGYQRRLIHQLVKNEFPGCRTFARNDKSFMQIEKTDPKKEVEFQKRNSDRFNSMVAKQTGLRWIFEALSGGDLEGIDPWWFCTEKERDATPEASRNTLAIELKEVAMALKAKKHVLVGHNLFTDLVYLYKTFIGTPPYLVRDFQKRVHRLFPIVIDTKYLATHEADSMDPREGLKALLEPFKKTHTPLIVLDERHNAYGVAFGKDHEAGFDSWMTAELFAKLSSKLYAEWEGHNEEELRRENIEEAGSDNEDESNGSDGSGGALLDLDGSDGHQNGHTNGSAMADTFPAAWHANQLNPYSVLAMHGDNEPSTPPPSQWIPAMESPFWKIYSNKLRVNGVEGGICSLSLIDRD